VPIVGKSRLDGGPWIEISGAQEERKCWLRAWVSLADLDSNINSTS
jgi:hypothetical protein